MAIDSKLSRGLYKDFTLTADNCHEEPIHRPMAVRGDAYLLAFTLPNDLPATEVPLLHAMTSNAAKAIGFEAHVMWGLSPKEWLPSQLLQAVTDAVGGQHYTGSNGYTWQIDQRAFDVSYHKHDGKLILECEPEPDTLVDDSLLLQCAQRIHACATSVELYGSVCDLVGAAFGYDRVMVYQFDDDKHGVVVGEYKQNEQEPFLGLHYPESDIPKIARDLFLRSKSRLIPDIEFENTTILLNPALGLQPPSLDLGHSQLRATSPIHVEYLANMGVRATQTLGIIIGGELWGLIACHHRQPKQICYRDRLTGEAIADLVGKRVLEFKIAEHEEQLTRVRTAESNLIGRIKLGDHYRVEIQEQSDAVQQLCECDGVALVTLDDCSLLDGTLPSQAQLFELRSWLVETKVSHLYHTTNASKDIPIKFEPAAAVGGILAACLSTLSNSYLIWFRQPVTQFVNWGGDVRNSFTVEKPSGGGEIRISPRQSFAKWQQAVEGQSLPWSSADVLMADRLRDVVFKKELLRTAGLVKRSSDDFTSMTFAAAHDLQEPLRTLSNYTSLLHENPDTYLATQYLHRIENATQRMQVLVSDLLNYASVGVERTMSVVDLSALLSSIVEDLEDLVSSSGALIEVDELPSIHCDREKVKQLFINFLTNAIKYVPAGTVPKVHVTAEVEGNFVVLSVRDNGIGIEPKYQVQVFDLFKRLHSKKEYAGTGIGLAICKKVAESHEFQIGVNSEAGEGSSFWLKIHNSDIASKS